MPERGGIFLWVRLFLLHYRFIIGVSALSAILTGVVVLLLPKWYEARATILPPHEDAPNFRALDQLSAVLQMEQLLPFTDQITLADIYLGILTSDTVARRLVDRFDLKIHYNQESLVKTLDALRSHSTIAPTRKRVLEVKVEDKDPELAAMLANAYVEELDTVFRETRSTAGKRQRVFLEERVSQARAELDSLDSALAEAQGPGMTALSGSLTEAAMAAGELLGKRLALSVQLEVLKESGVRSGPAKQQLEIELRALDTEIARLPGVGLDIARTIRDLRMQEFLYQELATQLEAAKIEEARDTPAVEILDVALPPDRHIRPRRGLAVVAGVFIGFAASFTWVVYSRSGA